jgi:hypothetical protein
MRNRRDREPISLKDAMPPTADVINIDAVRDIKIKGKKRGSRSGGRNIVKKCVK